MSDNRVKLFCLIVNSEALELGDRDVNAKNNFLIIKVAPVILHYVQINYVQTVGCHVYLSP